MGPNPVLKKLGFADTDRVAIFHADDIGMCQATLPAYAALLDGSPLSAAATVPAPWFPAAAALCRHEQPGGKIDMGVHLTLTSEWDAFRWGPISTTDPASGLIDDEGYFHRLAAPVQAGADLGAAGREMAMQIERALAAGVDVTHIDSHMFTNYHPRLAPVYFDLAFRYRLPALLVRGEERLPSLGVADPGMAAAMGRLTRAAEAEGLPLVDNILVMPLTPVANRLAHATKMLQELPAGVTCFIIHPAQDTPELRAMAPDWPARVDDLALFQNEAWQQAVRRSGIQVIGFRPLRDLLRAA